MSVKTNYIDSNGNTQVEVLKPLKASPAVNADQLTTLSQLNSATAAIRSYVPVRQTVYAGLLDSYGRADFLSISGTGIQLLATTTNVRATWAVGNDGLGAINRIYEWTTDVSPSAWNALADGTYYLYIDYNSGNPTYGATIIQPIYDTVAPTTPSAGQAWFNTSEYIMYVFDGSLWQPTEILFVGETVFSGGSPSTVATYAINGRYDSRWFVVNATTNYTLTHRIGVKLSQGVNTQFYFSTDSAGNDATIAADAWTFSGTITGHYSRANVPTIDHLDLRFGFASNVQVFRGSAVTTGYYRVIVQRMF